MVSPLAVAVLAAGLAGWAFWALRRIRRRRGGCACCTKACPLRGKTPPAP